MEYRALLDGAVGRISSTVGRVLSTLRWSGRVEYRVLLDGAVGGVWSTLVDGAVGRVSSTL